MSCAAPFASPSTCSRNVYRPATANSSMPTTWNLNLPNGSAASSFVTFNRAGAWSYHCNIHDSMKGTIRVTLKNTRIDSNSWTVQMGTGAAPTGFVHQLKFKKSTSIVGFVSHVQGDLKVKAQEAGCDVVMPRSAFSQNLPSILRRHGAEDEPEENFNKA